MGKSFSFVYAFAIEISISLFIEFFGFLDGPAFYNIHFYQFNKLVERDEPKMSMVQIVESVSKYLCAPMLKRKIMGFSFHFFSFLLAMSFVSQDFLKILLLFHGA